jgi:hypothetical protein
MHATNAIVENETYFSAKNLTSPTVTVSLNSEGLIPVESLTTPVEVTFPVWEGVTLMTSYQLVLDSLTVGSAKLIGSDDKPGDILTLHIPVDALTNGKHALSYRLVNLENGSTSDSAAVPLEIDRTPPGAPQLAPIIFPASVQDGLTSAELEEMGNLLTGEVAGYQDMKEGDVVRSYWGTVDGPVAIVGKDDMGLKRVSVKFSRDFLQSLGDGDSAVYYTVTDLAGNLSIPSQEVRVKLQLSVLPELPVPVLKEAVGGVLDPADTALGATVVVATSAQLRRGDRVAVHWTGPKGSDSKERLITDNEAGKELAVVFSTALVEVNKGQTVTIAYAVTRTSGSEQTSDTVAVQILGGESLLPAPTMDTVGPDGLLIPSNIPDSGATVRVAYAGMSSGDSVVVQWKGVSDYDTPAQVAAGDGELQFNVPKAFISQSTGGSASVAYTVTRASNTRTSAPLWMRVGASLVFDSSPVTLNGKVYLIPAVPHVLPAFPANTTVQRAATGGQPPYVYTSSDSAVAEVDATGLTSARGKGAATITVTDAKGETASYPVSVTGVIHCVGLGSGNFSQIYAAAGKQGARIPNLDELNQIFNSYGSRWPLGNSVHWSTTVAAQNLVGMKWYFVKNLVTGGNDKLKYHYAALGVGIR